MQKRLHSVKDYEQFVGSEIVDRILRKAAAFQDFRVINFNSTGYGGGVAEVLTSMTLLMNSAGIKAEWRVMQGRPDFFNITKKMHNALQGADINLSEIKTDIFEQVSFENAIRNRIDHDIVLVHDPQPLALIKFFTKRCPWVWRCHVDLSEPHGTMWQYLTDFVEMYDAVILSCRTYQQPLRVPQLFFMPAIDPFSVKNSALTDDVMDERLAHYGIPVDLPLVVQVSRFDRWKDPVGVIQAFKIARKEVGATLVLLGNFVTDDPEGAKVYEELANLRDERILVLSAGDDTALVNTLQRRASVVMQKSIREGFGLTVAEAMWKGTPVIGGNVGGIPNQIEDGVNGFLVSSVNEAAERLVQLLKDQRLREQMGKRAHATVAERFLLTRHLEQYLDLFGSFETIFQLRPSGIS
jgi:trehalose synthase